MSYLPWCLAIIFVWTLCCKIFFSSSFLMMPILLVGSKHPVSPPPQQKAIQQHWTTRVSFLKCVFLLTQTLKFKIQVNLIIRGSPQIGWFQCTLDFPANLINIFLASEPPESSFPWNHWSVTLFFRYSDRLGDLPKIMQQFTAGIGFQELWLQGQYWLPLILQVLLVATELIISKCGY